MDNFTKKINFFNLVNCEAFALLFVSSPYLIKLFEMNESKLITNYYFILDKIIYKNKNNINLTNILPSSYFKYVSLRKIYNNTVAKTFQENATPWYYHTLIRFMEHQSGRKSLFQFYPFLNNDVGMEHIIRYKR